jgi:predicted metal-dependent phosphoesterase TrpH
MAAMLRVEFHCHTSLSKDCLVPPARLVQCAIRKGIDRLIITDHNTISGALAARQQDPVRVIIGEEIMTTQGELLAAFVRSEIPPGLTPAETIARLKYQGAFISVSHPFDAHRKGAWREPDLLAILPFIDAIEIYNSRCMQPRHNAMAQDFAARHALAGTVGSDAHTCWELGRSTQLLPEFDTADDLRRVIGASQYATRWSPPWVHFTSRYAVWHKHFRRMLDTPHRA